MGIRQDFALAPAHAHLNLVGGVLLFLFGLYYRLVPGSRRAARSPRFRAGSISSGAIVFPIGVAHRHQQGDSRSIAVPIIGSLIVVMAVALFAVIVFRTTRAIALPCVTF